MELHRFNLTDMITGTSTWVGPASPIKSVAVLAPLYPKVEAAHLALVAVERRMRVANPELAAVLDALAELDPRWDQVGRVVDLGFTLGEQWALAQDPPDEKRAAEITVARSRVLPDGLRILNASYGNEASSSERLQHLLTTDAALKQLLGTLAVTKEVSLAQVAEQWIALGTQMRTLDRKRMELGGDESSGQPGEKVITFRDARNQWMKVVSTVLNTLEIADADAATVDAITRPLEEVAERAAKRTPTKKKTPAKT